MSILIIGPLPEPIDGCSYANAVLCKNFAKAGINYQTINTNTPNVASKQGTSFSFYKAFYFLKNYLNCYKIFATDAVYITPGQTFFGMAKYAPFILLCILLRVPYIIHVHGNYLGSEYQQLKGIKAKFFKLLLSKAAAGIVLSESLRKNFKGLLPSEKVYVVENFVDDTIIQSFRKDSKPIDKLRILYLSNLIEEKGILDLLDALIEIKTQKIDFQLQLAGKIETTIAAIIQTKLGELQCHVEYLGLVKGEEKIKVLQNANIFVLPTYYKMEGQPISILEALGAGNIIITTSHAGIPDIISTNNGYFVEPKNPNSIANIFEIIAKDIGGQINHFSESNAVYAKSRFTEQAFITKILEIIRTVTRNKI